MVVLLLICVFAAAVVASMMGQGGGTLYTPIQVWLGIEFHEAAATSLFLMVVMSISAATVYRKAGRIDWPLALTLESTTTVGAFLGGVLSAQFDAVELSILLSALLLTAAVAMVRPARSRTHTGGASRFAWKRLVDGRQYTVNLAIGVPLAFGIGVASGLTGIGGGVLKVPAMVLILGMPMKVAVGSSSLMVGITAAAGLVGHISQGHWNWRLSLILAGAVFVAGQIGSRLSLRLNTSRLRRIFGVFLLAVAGATIIKAVG